MSPKINTIASSLIGRFLLNQTSRKNPEKISEKGANRSFLRRFFENPKEVSRKSKGKSNGRDGNLGITSNVILFSGNCDNAVLPVEICRIESAKRIYLHS